MNNWISAEEQLPIDCNDKLVYYDKHKGTYGIASYALNRRPKPYWVLEGKMLLYNVIYWMDLPNVPEKV